MRKLLAFLCSAGLAVSLAGVAGATIYPPGPGGLCPDSVSIVNIQDPLQACHPIATDTVFSVRGVVNAIDSIGTAYGFFMQQLSGGPYSGIDVFTSASNYQGSVPESPSGGNIFYGDLLSVDGIAFEFNGLTEVTRRSAADPIMIRRVSSGNGFPPYHIGTPLELDWVPGWSSVNGAANPEPWEGCLVKVRGPLVCGRIVGTGVGSRSMLVSTPGGADTLCADGFSLTNIAALAVGTTIDSLQGVLTQVTISAIPSYRILMRNVGDLFAAAPPNVIDAYPVAENQIRVIYDRPVTLVSAQNTNNYSLLSFGSVNTAVLEAGSKSVLLSVSAAAPHGTQEAVTVSGVVSTSGLTMTGAQPRSFVYGILSLAEIQQPDTSTAGLLASPCRDRSRYVAASGGSGLRLSYTGVVTADFGSVLYLTDPAGGLRSGLPLFGAPTQLTLGHKYLISGQVQEFDGVSAVTLGGLTEAVNTQYLQDLGAAAQTPATLQTIHVLTDTTCDLNRNLTTAEDYEGMLVCIAGAKIVENRAAGQSFLIAGPIPACPDTILVSSLDNTSTFKPDSLQLVRVAGMLNWRTSTLPWRISPRNDADIYKGALGVGPQGPAVLRLAVTNPSRNPQVNFTLPTSGKVDLGVFDLTGRRLATIVGGTLPAGEYSKSWNGRSSSGIEVRSGVYFYRLKVGDKQATTTAIKLD